MDMRGLSTFISDIRKASTSKEEEQKRIDKELAKIRAKFKDSGRLNGYERKKYICKLLYMFMLGHDIDFGHMEAVHLLSSDRYSEKHIGYLACTILLNENSELLPLITNSIKADLVTPREHFQCLALTAIANVGGKEFAEAMAQDVQKILLDRSTKAIVRKKCALCLLRLYRKYPEIITPDGIVEPVLELLGSVDFGVVNCLCSLLLGFLAKDTTPFQGCVSRCIRVLSKIVISKDYTNDYVYYGVPAPWLQIKLFRILQHFAMPSDGALKNQITSVLNKVITASERIRSMDKSRTPSRNNSVNSVLIEAINLCVHYDCDRDLINMAANILGRFITDTKDANLRYLGLATMSRLAYCAEGDAMDHIRKHQSTIVLSLKDSDISIRRRALDLLYCTCDKSNAEEIVGELLEYLTVADFAIREDLVLKMAILSEKYASDYSWYIDVVLNIISQAGDFVSDDVYHRVVQIVTNNEYVQQHSAELVFEAVQSAGTHEVAVKVGGYILGEFGYCIADNAASGPLQQFQALNAKFPMVSQPTKALLLNTYIKFYNMYDNPQLKEKILKVFTDNRTNIDAEIQQRATEYSCLALNVKEETVDVVLQNMPQYSMTTSAVLQAMVKAHSDVTDKDVWMEKESRRVAEAERAQEEAAGEAGGETSEEPRIEIPAAKAEAPPPAPPGPDPMDALFSGGEAAPPPPAQTSSGGGGGGDFMDELFTGGAPAAPAPVAPAPVASGGVDSLFNPPAPAPVAAAPAAPAAPAGGISVDDLFSGGGGAAKAPTAPAPAGDPMDELFAPAAPAAPTRSADPMDDLFSGGGGAPAAPVVTTVPMDDARKAKCRQLWMQLLTKNNGVLYEDGNFQVGVKAQYQGPQGRMVLYFRNLTNAPITGVSSAVASAETSFRVAANTVGSTIAPAQHLQQHLNMECVGVFSQIPKLNVTYQAGSQIFQLPLDLPVNTCKFVEMLRMQSNENFITTWRNTPCTPNPPPSVVFFTATPISVEKVQNVLHQDLRFHVLRAVDGNQNNLVGAGTWYSSQQSTPVLINVENNLEANAVRLTVRTPSQQLADSLTAGLRLGLDEKPQ